MSKTRGWGIGALVVGLVLLAGGLVVLLVVFPSQAMFPDDVDTTRTYDGELAVMLNAAALESGDLTQLFVTDVPVTLSRHVQTTDVGGDNGAIVVEEATMTGPDGPVAASRDVYAIDRVTMEHIADFADNPEVIAREGLVIGWPIGTEATDYTGWNGDTLQTVAITFEGEEERAGLTTYRFHAASEPELIVDPVVLESFPAALPKPVLAQLATVLELPAGMAEQLGAMLEQMPDMVPLAYTYAFDKTYWIEPTSGVMVDIDVFESRAAVLPIPGADPVALTEVQQLSYVMSEASVADAVDDAEEATTMITLFGTVIPWSLIVVGGVLAIIGIWLLVRRPKEQVPSTSQPVQKAGV